MIALMTPSHRRGLDNNADCRKCVFTIQAGHRRQLSQAKFLALDRYMRKYCWRYNRRRMQASIFEMALASMVSRTPLPYKKLVAF